MHVKDVLRRVLVQIRQDPASEANMCVAVHEDQSGFFAAAQLEPMVTLSGLRLSSPTSLPQFPVQRTDSRDSSTKHPSHVWTTQGEHQPLNVPTLGVSYFNLSNSFIHLPRPMKKMGYEIVGSSRGG